MGGQSIHEHPQRDPRGAGVQSSGRFGAGPKEKRPRSLERSLPVPLGVHLNLNLRRCARGRSIGQALLDVIVLELVLPAFPVGAQWERSGACDRCRSLA